MTERERHDFGSALENPVGGRELWDIGWDEYAANLKRPYPKELVEEARRKQSEKDRKK
jgi:hypothetical protein